MISVQVFQRELGVTEVALRCERAGLGGRGGVRELRGGLAHGFLGVLLAQDQRAPGVVRLQKAAHAADAKSGNEEAGQRHRRTAHRGANYTRLLGRLHSHARTHARTDARTHLVDDGTDRG